MIHYALESVFLISSLIRVLLAYIWLQSSTLGGKILSDESILSLLQDAPSVSTMKLCRFSAQLYCTNLKEVLLKSPECKYWFQAPKCKQFYESLTIILCIIEPVADDVGSQNLSGWKGPQEVPNPAFSSKQCQH